jgi:hypothetical protein
VIQKCAFLGLQEIHTTAGFNLYAVRAISLRVQSSHVTSLSPRVVERQEESLLHVCVQIVGSYFTFPFFESLRSPTGR